ncbi:MAG TPA: hypothetical protein VFP72_16375 [Kineosporiaceae bacterium]|nr:hypothetical protein [Kineosporiaceae bacterium]
MAGTFVRGDTIAALCGMTVDEARTLAAILYGSVFYVAAADGRSATWVLTREQADQFIAKYGLTDLNASFLVEWGNPLQPGRMRALLAENLRTHAVRGRRIIDHLQHKVTPMWAAPGENDASRTRADYRWRVGRDPQWPPQALRHQVSARIRPDHRVTIATRALDSVRSICDWDAVIQYAKSTAEAVEVRSGERDAFVSHMSRLAGGRNVGLLCAITVHNLDLLERDDVAPGTVRVVTGPL